MFFKKNHEDAVDALSGAMLKEAFCNRVKAALGRNGKKEYLLIATNLLDFSVFNDLYGCECGDEVIKRFMGKLQAYAGEDGIIGRFEGDVFLLLLPRLRFSGPSFFLNVLSGADITGKTAYNMQISAGLYRIADSKEPVEKMISRAILACRSVEPDSEYNQKYYTPDLDYRIPDNPEYEKELRQAIKNHEFIPFLQPQCDAEGRLLACEALVRWKKPAVGIVPPSYFVEACEDFGLVSKLDYEIWKQTCEILSQWEAAGYSDIPVAVNVSPHDLIRMDIVAVFKELRKKYSFSSRNLRLEITETAFVKNKISLFEQFSKLRECGFYIEMDDFGTQYSSLALLNEMNFDIIKIDAAFIKEMNKNMVGAVILEFIFNLTKLLKVASVVEGVETEAQLKILADIGYTVFQGYYFSPPVSRESFEEKFFGISKKTPPKQQ